MLMLEFPEIPPAPEAHEPEPEPELDAIDHAAERRLYGEPMQEFRRLGHGGPNHKAVSDVSGVDFMQFQTIVASIVETSYDVRDNDKDALREFGQTVGAMQAMMDLALIMFVAGQLHERNGGGDLDD